MTTFWIALASAIGGGFAGFLACALLTVASDTDDATELTEAYRRGYQAGINHTRTN